MKINIVRLCAFIAAISFFGCEKQGLTGLSSLINLSDEAPGTNCAAGGVKVVSGLDANRDNILEDNEIQNVKYVCNSTQVSDKQLIIYFPANGVGYSTSSASGYIDTIEVLRDFNILNYSDADSITFSAYLQTSDSSVSCTVNLFNMTDNTPINNTTLTSNSTNVELKTTQVNFLNDLPHTPIKLGIQVRSGQEGTVVYYILPMITIYRH